MHLQTALTFTLVASVAIASPGPAVLLALRNSMAFGPRTVVWSALGNVSGLFLLSAAAMAGLGVLLQSSALLFEAVKLVGALYLFYIGLRHLTGRASVSLTGRVDAEPMPRPRPARLYGEALLTASTNPKPILFFTALFPQFMDANSPLFPQFLILTGIFMALSFLCLMGYALVAARARTWLMRPKFARWTNWTVGAAFVSFGAGLLALQRRT